MSKDKITGIEEAVEKRIRELREPIAARKEAYGR